LFWLTILLATLETPLRAAADESDAAERPENGYWSLGKPRWFVSQRTEIGTPYAKPYVSAGYGLPHWIWTGVDVNAILTMDCLQVYSGVRATTPLLDLAFGVRDTFSFGKPYLEPQLRYTANILDGAPGPNARYWAWEAEVVGTLPLPYAAIVGDFIAVGMLDVPDGVHVYDESYRAIVADDQFFVMRAAAVTRFLNEFALKIGVMVEHIFGTGRGEPVTRVGPAASLQLTDHLDINAVLTVAVSGPDDLGLVHGSYGVAGIRYRSATGERRPAWPWQEQVIP
jgi:hypothetical protein